MSLLQQSHHVLLLFVSYWKLFDINHMHAERLNIVSLRYLIVF